MRKGEEEQSWIKRAQQVGTIKGVATGGRCGEKALFWAVGHGYSTSGDQLGQDLIQKSNIPGLRYTPLVD